MHDRAVTWPNFEGLNPTILFEAWNENPLIVHNALRRDLEVDRHFKDGIGLADRPTLGEFQRRWRVSGIAFRRAGIGPFCEHIDFALIQPSIVPEMPD